MKKLIILLSLISCNQSYYYPIVKEVKSDSYLIEITNGKEAYNLEYKSEECFEVGDTLKFTKQ